MFDLIIRGAEICVGSGVPRASGDIADAGDRIAGVGAARLIQRPIGIEHLLVNGVSLIDAGLQTDAGSGAVLRGA